MTEVVLKSVDDFQHHWYRHQSHTKPCVESVEGPLPKYLEIVKRTIKWPGQQMRMGLL